MSYAERPEWAGPVWGRADGKLVGKTTTWKAPPTAAGGQGKTRHKSGWWIQKTGTLRGPGRLEMISWSCWEPRRLVKQKQIYIYIYIPTSTSRARFRSKRRHARTTEKILRWETPDIGDAHATILLNAYNGVRNNLFSIYHRIIGSAKCLSTPSFVFFFHLFIIQSLYSCKSTLNVLCSRVLIRIRRRRRYYYYYYCITSKAKRYV